MKTNRSKELRSFRRRALVMRMVLPAALLLAALTLAAACGSGDNAGTSEDALISEGAVAPDFDLPAVGGETVSLNDYSGEKNALLYFSMGSG